MTTYLLDVNVLIALIDPAHVQHDTAHVWFASTGSHSWATCPLTENGVLRIVGHGGAANPVMTSPGGTMGARELAPRPLTRLIDHA